MKVILTRVGPSGVIETAEKELDGSIDSEMNQHRLDVLQYGLTLNADRTSPGPCYNLEDPLQQCMDNDSCSWATYRVVP